MAWDFLRQQRGNRTNVRLVEAEVEPDIAAGEADVHHLKNFDARAIGVAREAINAKLSNFEDSLQALSQLPDQFRQVMSPIENSINTLANMRSRLEIVEDSLKNEQARANNLDSELSASLAETDRLSFRLKAEEGAHASYRNRASDLESNVQELRREHSELTAKINRLEPLYRETLSARDASENENAELRSEKVRVDEALAMASERLGNTLEDIISKDSLLAEQELTGQRLFERLETAQAASAQLEASLNSVNDKLNQVAAALQKERNTSSTLRSEQELYLREREVSRLQSETQLEASRSRYRLVEKMLEEARSRFREETRQLSIARNERALRDRENGQLITQIDMLRREIAELRSQVNSSEEGSVSSANLISNEIEARRKLELELDVLRVENAGLVLKQRSLTDDARSNHSTLSEVNNLLQTKYAIVRTENDQLRAEMSVLRAHKAEDNSEEIDVLLASHNNENVISIR